LEPVLKVFGRCGASQMPGDETVAKDKGIQKIAFLAAGSNVALFLACKALKLFERVKTSSLAGCEKRIAMPDTSNILSAEAVKCPHIG